MKETEEGSPLTIKDQFEMQYNRHIYIYPYILYAMFERQNSFTYLGSWQFNINVNQHIESNLETYAVISSYLLGLDSWKPLQIVNLQIKKLWSYRINGIRYNDNMGRGRDTFLAIGRIQQRPSESQRRTLESDKVSLNAMETFQGCRDLQIGNYKQHRPFQNDWWNLLQSILKRSTDVPFWRFLKLPGGFCIEDNENR